jgi:hypothetical protein
MDGLSGWMKTTPTHMPSEIRRNLPQNTRKLIIVFGIHKVFGLYKINSLFNYHYTVHSKYY